MSPITLALFALCMFANAVVFSMLGQGGGVLYTPIQVLFGIEFHTAAATSLLLIMVASISSTLVFRTAHKVDWATGIALESSTTVGAFCGGWASHYISANALSAVFSVFIVFAAVFMLRDFERVKECPAGPSSFFAWKREVDGERYCINLPLGLPLAFIAGIVSGLMGIAGGLLKIPMLVVLFAVPMEIAVASSSFMVGLTAAGGFAGHLTQGHVNWKTILILSPIVFIGASIGARASLHVNEKKLKKIFGWFLLLIAAALLFRVFFFRG
jgi:uncharacterized membrane protein YfcA